MRAPKHHAPRPSVGGSLTRTSGPHGLPDEAAGSASPKAGGDRRGAQGTLLTLTASPQSRLVALSVLLLGVAVWTVFVGGAPDVSQPTPGVVPPDDDVERLGSLNGRALAASEADGIHSGPQRLEAVPEVLAATPELEPRPPEPQPAARPEVRVEGRVTDRFSVPVEGAEVRLTVIRGDHPSSRARLSEPVTTGRDGVFAFHARGYRDLVVSLEVRHAEAAFTTHRESFRTVEPNQTLDVGDVQVVGGGVVLGSVTDEAGMAVPDATVRLHPQDDALREDPRRWRLFPRVAVDGGGRFRIVHVRPGRYRLDAVAPDHERRYTDLITIADGESVRVDPLRLGSRLALAGRVVDPAGAPIDGASVSLLRARGGGRRSTETGGDGRFVFDHLPNDVCSISVEADGYLRENRHGVPILESPPLDFTLTPGLRIRGVVRDGVTGRTVDSYAARVRLLHGAEDRARSRLSRDFHALVDRLEQELDGSRGDEREKLRREMERQVREAARQLRAQGVEVDTRGHRRSGQQDDDPNSTRPGDAGAPEHREGGRFEFSGLQEGTYVVDISSPDHVPLRSPVVELRRGSSPELSLTLERGLVVAGRVVDEATGAPMPDARVDLMFPRPPPKPGRRLSPRRALRARLGSSGPRAIHCLHTRTNELGEFRIAQAAAGTCLLRARARGHADRFSGPFDLESDASGFELALGELGVIHGRVDGLSPDEVESARVVVIDLDDNEIVKVRADMSYRAEALHPGRYLVRAYVGRYDDHERVWLRRLARAGVESPDVELGEGAEVRFDVRIERGSVGDVVGEVLVDGVGREAQGHCIHLREILDASGGVHHGSGLKANRFDAFVDQNGDYAFADLPAGRYRMSLRCDGPDGEEVEVLRREIRVFADRQNRPPPIELTREDIERAADR